MTDGPDVSIVIVAYRTRDLLEACLASVPVGARRTTFEVVVVDNAADHDDGTAEMVRTCFPDVRYVDAGGNLGFARACNLGARVATGRNIVLLNPDTVVLDGAFDALVDLAAARPDAGIVGGRTLRPDGTVDPSSCWGAVTLWSLTCWATGLSAAFKGSERFDPESLGGWQRDSVREVGIVTGCLLLAPRDVWERLGGFDEDYFMYGEDADLSWRARRAGYRPTVTPDAEIVHLVGASSSSTADRLVIRDRGKITLVRRMWSGRRRALAVGLYLTGVAVRALAYGTAARLRRRDPAEVPAVQVWRRRAEWSSGYPPRGRSAGATAGGALSPGG